MYWWIHIIVVIIMIVPLPFPKTKENKSTQGATKLGQLMDKKKL